MSFAIPAPVFQAWRNAGASRHHNFKGARHFTFKKKKAYLNGVN
ncbi:hypothetical protein BN133_3876 [Cronobacter dublinensis 582]|nr:hypothetical protein BN133_3876 [Cronobacter dublinensis 582]